MIRWFSILAFTISCLTPAWAQSPEQKRTTIAYVQSCQQKDGGFLPSRPGSALVSDARLDTAESSLRATNAALRVLKYLGGTVRDKETCGAFVRSCFDEKKGGFADHPGAQPNVATTAVGLLAVVELALPVENYRAGAVKYLDEHVKSFEDIRIAVAGLEAVQAKSSKAGVWLEQITKMRNNDGTFGVADAQARASGGAVVALLRLGANVGPTDKVVQALRAGQRSDGGFGKEQVKNSDLETTYRVMRCFFMLKERPDVVGLRKFIANCRNEDGGYGIAPGQPSQVGPTYFAAICLHWLEEK